MGHLVRKAELLDRGSAVSAADDCRRALCVRHSLCNGDCALRERRVLEYSHRAVPDDRLRALYDVGEQLLCLVADVESHLVGRDCIDVDRLDRDLRVDGVGERRRNDGVDRQIDCLAELFRLGEHVLAIVHLLVVDQRLADLIALRREEGVRHAAADDEAVALVEQVVDDLELVRDLRAAEHRDERSLGRLERVSHDLELLLNQEAADSGLDESVFDDRGGRSVRTVRCAESVVDIDVAIGSELTAELFASALLLRIETQILEQHALSALACGDLRLRVLADDVLCERHFAAEQLVEPVRNRLEREFDGIVLERLGDVRLCRGGSLVLGKSLDRLLFLLGQTDLCAENAVRLAHMRAKDDLCAVLHQIFDRRQRADDASIVGDYAVLHRDVEVHSDEAALAVDVYVSDCHLVHSYLLGRQLRPYDKIFTLILYHCARTFYKYICVNVLSK